MTNFKDIYSNKWWIWYNPKYYIKIILYIWRW